jgi:hypothetical protein
MATLKHPDINPSLPFQFLVVEDCGNACCPHCGAEGRYIYHWAEFGKAHSAMAGCYAALTGRINKDDREQFFETLSKKLATGKPLNGWQKTVMRMQAFIQEGKYSVEWCERKIMEAISDQKRFAFKKAGMH